MLYDLIYGEIFVHVLSLMEDKSVRYYSGRIHLDNVPFQDIR